MKKVIAIVAIVVIALVGLTSYNGSEMKKEKNDDRLVAMLKTSKGDPIKIADPKKKD